MRYRNQLQQRVMRKRPLYRSRWTETRRAPVRLGYDTMWLLDARGKSSHVRLGPTERAFAQVVESQADQVELDGLAGGLDGSNMTKASLQLPPTG